jgi:hypothetical protein
MTTHSQSSAEVRTEYSYTFTSPLCPHGCYKENFAFLYVQVSSLYNNAFCQPSPALCIIHTVFITYAVNSNVWLQYLRRIQSLRLSDRFLRNGQTP